MDNISVTLPPPRQPDHILTELLVLQAQSGNQEALTQLIHIWTPKLTLRAAKLSQCTDATSEIVQESWIGIARGLRSLKDPARFGPWTMRIVHHKAADWIKAQTKQRALNAQLQNSSALQSQPDQPDQDQAHQIRTAIGHLNPKLRELVYLFYMDNLTLEQIALTLNIPLGTAKTRLKRARNQLKPILEQLLERSTP